MSYIEYTNLISFTESYPSDVRISELDSQTLITLTIKLSRPRSPGNLTVKDYADGILSGVHATLSRSEFDQLFGVLPQNFDLVREFGEYFGMMLIEEQVVAASIVFSAPVSTINRAFDTIIEQITLDNYTYIRPQSSIRIPKELEGVIEHVFGLDTWSFRNLSHPLKTPVFSANLSQIPFESNSRDSLGNQYVLPKEVVEHYRFPYDNSSNGLGLCIGIIQLRGGYSTDNLNKTFSKMGFSNPPNIVVAAGTNNTELPLTDAQSSWVNEVMLDLSVVGGAVPGAKIALYFASNTFSDTVDFPNVFNKAFDDTVNKPSVLSFSWSYQESQLAAIPYGTGTYLDYCEGVLARSLVIGVTVVCASGDRGSFENKNSRSVGYPASSKYVLSVGGTSLILNTSTGAITTETVWAESSGVSGGGISDYINIPDWQKTTYAFDANGQNRNLTYRTFNIDGDLQISSANSLSNQLYRGLPDVAAQSSVATGYLYYSSTWNVEGTDIQSTSTLLRGGGTSAAAPMVASLILKLNQLTSGKLGFTNPYFYDNENLFNDIYAPGVTNSWPYGSENTSYVSTPGWDPITGLGTFDGTRLLENLNGKPFLDNISVSIYQNTTATIYLNIPTSLGYIKNIFFTALPYHGVINLQAPKQQDPAQPKNPNDAENVLLYTPNLNYIGLDSFQLKIVNSKGIQSDNVLVTITVLGYQPIANDTSITVQPNSIKNKIIPPVTNFFNKVNVTSTVSNRGGAITASTVLLYYTPPINYVGTDAFQYTASNPSGTSTAATVYITIIKPPAPKAYNILKNVIYNSVSNIIDPSIQGTYTSITVDTISQKNGTAIIANNKIFYSPPLNYIGKDSFSYTAIGYGNTSSSATVSITVLNSSSYVTSYNVSQFVKENSQNNVVNLSDTEPTGNLSVMSTATHGVSTVTDNVILYTPYQNYVGFDQFTYRVTNNYGSSTIAVINISVNSINYTPLVFVSTASVFQYSDFNILTPIVANSATGVIINSSPIFGTAGSSGTNIVYKPTYGFIGIDYFYYSAFNDAGISNPVKFYVNVVSVKKPTALDTSTTVSYNSRNNIILLKVVGPFNTATVVTPPLHGITTSSGFTIYYTPSTGYFGTDTFSYVAGNLIGLSKSANVNVTVSPSIGFGISPPSGNLPKGSTGTEYVPLVFTGINGTRPFTSSISSGTLPQGMTLTNNILSGTPATGSDNLYNISVTLRDSSTPTSQVATGTYVLDIAKNAFTLITTSSFNLVQSSCSNLITTIYGNTGSTFAVTTSSLVKAYEWDLVYDDILKCYIHQNGADSNVNLIRPNTGTFISLGVLDSYKNKLSSLTDSYRTAHPSQLLIDYNNTFTLSTSTLILQTYVINYKWANSDLARYYFNLGGYINISMYNTATQAQTLTKFTLSNYISNIRAIVISTTSVINGTGTVIIENKDNIVGSVVVATVQISTSTAMAAKLLSTLTNYYSTDESGGLLAPRPTTELVLVSGQLSSNGVGTVTVLGNTVQTLNIPLSNTLASDLVITSDDISYQSSNSMPLTVTYLDLPKTISANSTGTLRINLQNPTAVGGSFNINFRILANITVVEKILINTIYIPVNVLIKFGITASLSISGEITKNTDANILVTGYGGVMDTAYIINSDFKTNSTVFDTTVSGTSPRICRIYTTFNIENVANGEYNTSLVAYGNAGTNTDQKTVTTNLTINVIDKNLGSWLSGQDKNNAVMGFSYDIFSGIPTLTMGFASIPSLSSGGYPTYSNNSIPSLQRPVAIAGSQTFLRYANSSYGTFFNTYGIKTSGDISASFFVRYSGNYQWSISSVIAGSLKIDSVTVATQGVPNPTSYQQGSVYLTGGNHQIYWQGSGLSYTDQTSVYAVTLNNSWSGFMNTYAVWGGAGVNQTQEVVRNVYIPTSGNYTITAQGDNYIAFSIDGSSILSTTSYQNSTAVSNYLTAGYHVFSMSVKNTGGPAGFAVLVQNASGNTIWHTRTTLTATTFQTDEKQIAIRLWHIDGQNNGYTAWSTLNLGYDTLSWSEITRIPLINDRAYRSYTQLPVNQKKTYSSYFSDPSSRLGMWTVTNDGLGNLTISVNKQAETTSDASITQNLNNVQKDLIYYYSGISDRLSNLESSFGNNQTHIFLGFYANGTVITSTASAPIQPPPPPPAPSGGGGGGGGGGNNIIPILIIIGIATGWICFKKNTKIQMSNGKTKDIGNIEIGDYVYNYNKTSINQVRFIIRSKLNGKLYSPNSEIEPFGSKNHPLISESGDIISYDSHYCNKNYHWLGTCKQIEPVSSCEVEDEVVYNILVDGDGTYTVNGIGTTSVIGDGGAIINCVDNKLITEQQAMEFLKYIHDRAGIALYIWYKINKVLAKTTNQMLLKFYANTIKFIIKK